MTRYSAFAVNGGKVPAEMLRTLNWAATNGANGIVKNTDFKVSSLPVPAGAVRIGPGGAILKMQSWGTYEQQSYIIAQDAATNLSIPAAGASGRTDYIIARIDDWHYTADPAPADPENALYWSFQRVSTLNGISYPHVPLARLKIPAGASQITNSMVTDLREVANPRSMRRLFAYNMTSTDGIQELIVSQPQEQYWPKDTVISNWEIDVPEWATHANIVASWNGISVVPASNKKGVIWARLGRPDGWGQGNVETQHQHWDLGGSATGREHWEIADDVEIPLALRGTTQPLRMLGMRIENLTGQGPKLNNGSSVKFDIEFLEVVSTKPWQGNLH